MADVRIEFNSKAAQKWLKGLSDKAQNVRMSRKDYVDSISSFVFQDYIDHFDKERGPEGEWKPWSAAYTRHMRKIGKGGNRILQDTGRLRQSFVPSNYRTGRGRVEWFNPAKTKGGFPYAAAHNEGGPQLPRREFMWLSDKALKQIEGFTLWYITKK